MPDLAYQPGPALGGAADQGMDIMIVLSGTDPEAQPLTFAIATGPAHGTLGAITPIGPTSASVRYISDPAYSGADSFTYTANDGVNTSVPATVTIDVIDVDDPPVAYPQTVDYTGAAMNIQLTGNDPEGQPLTFRITTYPVFGTITNFNAATGSLDFTVAGGTFVGPDFFDFDVWDGTLWSPATAQVTVRGSWGGVPDAFYILGGTARNRDVDGSGYATGWNNGEIQIAPEDYRWIADHLGDRPAWHIWVQNVSQFTLDNIWNYAQTASLPTHTLDHIEWVMAQALSNAPGPNNPPTADDQTVDTTENAPPVAIMLTGSDPESGPLVFAIATQPNHGTLGALTQADPLVYEANTTYTPDPEFDGQDTFTFTITDGFNPAVTGIVTINVVGVNDPPIANDMDVEVPNVGIDSHVEFFLDATDPEDENMTFAMMPTPQPVNGLITYFNATTGEVHYNPRQPFQPGQDTFSYRARDARGGWSSTTEEAAVVTLWLFTDQLVVSIDSPADGFSAPADQQIAFVGSVAGGQTPYQLSWDFGDGGTATGDYNPTHTYTIPGYYTVTFTVTDDNGLSDTDEITVEITGAAGFSVDISAVPPSPEENQQVQFTSTITGGTGPLYQYSWNFGDGTPISTADDPTHTYATAGDYDVSLSVFDQGTGLVATDQMIITVVPPPPP